MSIRAGLRPLSVLEAGATTGGGTSRRRPPVEDLGRATARLGTATMGMTGPVRRGDRRALDELLVGAWEGLSAGRAVPCPWCAGPMWPAHGGRGTDAGRRRGSCGDCGSELR